MRRKAVRIVGLVLSVVLIASGITFLVFRDRPALQRLERLALYWGSRFRLVVVRTRGAIFRKIEGQGEGGAPGELGRSISLFLDAEDFSYSVKPLFDDAYFDEVLGAIEGADNSVKVALTHIDRGRKNSPADRLVSALVDARKRGASVEVVLDYPQSRFGGETAVTGPYKKNEEAIDYLKRRGCEASFDTPERALHDKLILIDEDVAFVGTHNWTEDSLSGNDEVSVLIHCYPTSAIFQEHFEEIEKSKKPESREMRLQEILKRQKELLER